jgi:hypothetical protein
VLCYYLQHPSLYAPAGLNEARRLLATFLVDGLSTEEVRRRNRDRVDSGKRQWMIKATPSERGTYANPVSWTMTASDVTARGVDRYCESVRAWANSVYESLQASGNLSI